MSPSRDVMVGLVTHGGSQFRIRGQETLDQVVGSLVAGGIPNSILVSDRNDADPIQHVVNRATVMASARHQARLEARWRAHIAGRQPPGPSGPLTLTMRARRSFNSVGSIRRLLNIDYSHLRLWRHALATGASAALVLEDDAMLVDHQVGDRVAELLPRMQEMPVMVNLSQSIGVGELGIESILREAKPLEAMEKTRIVQPDRAVTNTVCANLYNREFLELLVSFVDTQGLTPVAPIDWRVNEFLLSNHRAVTWWMEPAPFVQGSMHAK